MKLACLLLSGVADYVFTAKRRWSCLRAGHRLLCTTDGHTCVNCGRFYGYWD